MKNLTKLTSLLVLAAGSTFAATNNTTASAGVQPYLGSAPVVGFVSATVISTTAPIKANLPTSAKTITSWQCGVRDTSGNPKNMTVTISGTDFLVAASGQPSATAVVLGDVLNCTVQYQR